MADHTAMREYMLRLLLKHVRDGKSQFVSEDEASEFFYQWLSEEQELGFNRGIKLYQELHGQDY